MRLAFIEAYSGFIWAETEAEEGFDIATIAESVPELIDSWDGPMYFEEVSTWSVSSVARGYLVYRIDGANPPIMIDNGQDRDAIEAVQERGVLLCGIVARLKDEV